MRMAILAQGCASAGGLVISQAFLSTLSRVAPDHEYLFLIPPGVGYEAICASFPQSTVVPCAQGSALRRLLFDHLQLRGVLRAFQPDAILGLGSLGMANPGCAQAVFVHQPHLIYPKEHFGERSLRDKLRHTYLRWRCERWLAATQLIMCQTAVVERRIREQYGFVGTTDVWMPTVSPMMDGAPSGNAIRSKSSPV